jgi:hypothetical protein
MTKRFLLTVLILSLAAPVLRTPNPAHAGGMWFAWLYNPATEQLIELYEDGTTEASALVHPASERMVGSPPAFHPEGVWLAYCTFEDATSTLRVRVQDLGDPNPKAGITLPAVFEIGQAAIGQGGDCSLDPTAFNRSNPAQLVVSVLRGQGYPSRTEWDILVLDLTTGGVAYQLNSASPEVAPLANASSPLWFPITRRFDGDQVSFTMVPWGGEPLPQQDAYTWNLATGTLTSAPEFGAWIWQSNPSTGESVWLVEDSTLPKGTTFGPTPSFNVVIYESGRGSPATMIYHSPDSVIYSAVFVNGGRDLVIQLQPPFDPATGEPPDARWVLLDRTGAVRDLTFSGPSPLQVVGMRDGFLAWVYDRDVQKITITSYHLTEDRTLQAMPLWESTDPNWTILWGYPAAAPESLDPFPTFTP